MIIKNITIENFRSYYGRNYINVGSGLTLIIGANGDGKTTLFEALEWLFDTVGKMQNADNKYISKKKSNELFEGDFASVKVSMTYETEDSERIVEKSFRFSKLNGEIIPSNYSFGLYIQKGVEKEYKEGDLAKRIFDIDFAASIRQYCLFKGEQELNIFNKPEAMSYLVETFSEVRDFDPFEDFVNKATQWSNKAMNNAIKTDKKNQDKTKQLQSLINNELNQIGITQKELNLQLNEAQNFGDLIRNLEKNKEASQLLVSTNRRLDSLREDLDKTRRNISENYNYRLLDEMWILMGFEPIAEEYRDLVSVLDKEQRKQELEYQREQGAKKVVSKMQNDINQGYVPLALNVPDEKTMREMLHDEVCKVCGTPAPKGSIPYNTMKKHLDDYLESLKEVKSIEDEKDCLFKNEYIKELTGRYSVLHNNMNWVTKLNSYIDTAIEKNCMLHERISLIRSNIEREEETKRKVLAQTDGMTEEQLTSAYNNITEWWSKRADAEKTSEKLKLKLAEHEKLLKDYQEQFSEIASDSPAAMYSRTATAIRRIAEAFEFAKKKNKNDFLLQLEQTTNNYLDKLNKGDFRGSAKIIERVNNSAELYLIDTDGSRIHNPNTALKTTMYMALLFAVSELTTRKREDDFPLIFDAPTSSFTTAKESDFFNVIGDIEKQTIIVTKSFLTDNEDGSSSINLEQIKNINGKIYRIEKKRPFIKDDLSTIQTEITEL